jgi:acyl-CoA thioesterase I
MICSLTLAVAAAAGTVASLGAPRAHAMSARVWSIVTLGDSVPRGTNCHCTPYPQLIAGRLTAKTGRTVSSTNDSVAGFTTANVLRQLTSDQNVIRHVRSADAVEIEVGANDVPYTTACGSAAACYVGRIPAVRTRLAAIVSRIHALTSGHRTEIVLLDYWSIWLGGRYARARGSSYVATAKAMTGRLNGVIRSVAAATGSGYVDLRAAFNGPNYAYDETHYLSSDGDHPDTAGHKRIAAAAQAEIQAALHI